MKHTVVAGVRDLTGVRANRRGAAGVLPGVFNGIVEAGTC
jgi:hypothetical protein